MYRMCTISQPGYIEYIVTMDTLKCSPAREWLTDWGISTIGNIGSS